MYKTNVSLHKRIFQYNNDHTEYLNINTNYPSNLVYIYSSLFTDISSTTFPSLMRNAT